jgi:hypothetical protein
MNDYIDADVKAADLLSSSDEEHDFFADVKPPKPVDVDLEFVWVCFL